MNKKHLLIATLGLAGALAAGVANAGVSWSVGINAPIAPGVDIGTVVSGGHGYGHGYYGGGYRGGYYRAAPVYVAPAPVVYGPAPVVYGPPVVYGAPVYVAPRPVYAPRRVIYAPAYLPPPPPRHWRHHGY